MPPSLAIEQTLHLKGHVRVTVEYLMRMNSGIELHTVNKTVTGWTRPAPRGEQK